MDKRFRQMIGVLAAIAVSAFAMNAGAALSLDEIFGEGMVLQRKRPIPVFGTCDAGATVTVTLDGKSKTAKAGEDGKWKLFLPAMKAGGPFVMTVSCGDEVVEIADVMVGEVWIMAGQSNMEWSIGLCIDDVTYRTLQDFDHPNIRLFVQKVYDDQPDSHWDKAHSFERLKDVPMPWWSVLTCLVAQRLNDALGGDIPLGFIQAAQGNTPIESFMTQEMLDIEPALAGHFAGDPADANHLQTHVTSYAYDKFIRDIEGYGIRGVMFYQGEANTQKQGDEYLRYGALLERFISCWREKFGKDTPFVINSLATWYVYDPNEQNLGQYINIQVADTLGKIPGTALVNNIDIRSANLIHPTYKSITADRCVAAAMALCYGGKAPYRNPCYKGHKVVGSTVVVSFDNVRGGLKRAGFWGGHPVLGFQIAGEDKVFRNANAEIYGGDKVRLFCDKVPAPVYVRYAFGTSPQLNLYSADGLPLVQFDTSGFGGAPESDGYAMVDFTEPVAGKGEFYLKFAPARGVVVKSEGTEDVGPGLFFSWDEFGTSTGGRHFQRYEVAGIPTHASVVVALFRGKVRDDVMGMEGSAGFLAYNVSGKVDYANLSRDTMPAAENHVGDCVVLGNVHNGMNLDVSLDASLVPGNGTVDVMYLTTGTSHQNWATIIEKSWLYVAVKPEKPDSLALVAPPAKTEYLPGDVFDPAGMSGEAVYGGERVPVADVAFTFDPATIREGDTSVKAYYGGASVSVPITVKAP